MTIRHIGYGIEDCNGDVYVPGRLFNEEIVNDSLVFAELHLKEMELKLPEFSPHKIVRVLIDDEVDSNG